MDLLVRPGRLGPWFLGPAWISAAMLCAFSSLSASCSSNDKTADGSSADGGTTDDTPLPPILDGGGTLPEARDGAALCPYQQTCNLQTGAGCSDAQTCAPT